MPKADIGLALLMKGKPTKKTKDEDEEVAEDEYAEDEGEALLPEEDIAAATEVTMPIPAGLDLSDIEPGDTKELLTVIRKNDDETMSIIKVEGVDIGGGAPEAPSEAPPGESMPPPPMGGIGERAMGAGLM